MSDHNYDYEIDNVMMLHYADDDMMVEYVIVIAGNVNENIGVINVNDFDVNNDDYYAIDHKIGIANVIDNLIEMNNVVDYDFDLIYDDDENVHENGTVNEIHVVVFHYYLGYYYYRLLLTR